MIVEFGPREPGFVEWLKYRPNGGARLWLYAWRIYWSTLEFSAEIGQPMTRWRTLKYTAGVIRQVTQRS